MSYHGLGSGLPDFNPAVDSALKTVRQAKVTIGKAQVFADKHQLEKKHWDKLGKAEQAFQRSLKLLDKVAPKHIVGMADKIGGQVGILALLAALGLIGSTLLLHVWVNRNQDGEEEDEDEYEDEYEDDEEEEAVVVVEEVEETTS